MTILVSILSTGKGTWGRVFALSRAFEWKKVILIGDSFVKQRFTPGPNDVFLEVDFNKDITGLKKDIYEKVNELIDYPEVALNICSGEGKIHTALISALLSCGCAIRFVELDNEGKVIEV